MHLNKVQTILACKYRRQASYLWKKKGVEIRKVHEADTMKTKNRKGKSKTTFYCLLCISKSRSSFKNLYLGHSSKDLCSALLLNSWSSFTV